MMDAATLTYDTLRFSDVEDFPETAEPVWILGKNYSALTEKEEIFCDVTSRLWFTYRKGFPAIGGMGPTSDTGWGCMLRCGQMIFAQALVCRHLGRDWRWRKEQRQRDNYFSVLHAFIDKKDSCYSIHQIAQMGVGEGKSIGQWYGPNTVAQVLKKLAAFDSWSMLAVHIAMDNTVVIEDIKRLCAPCSPCAGAAASYNGYPGAAGGADSLSQWKPLVLLIPLRLGLSDINEGYIETLKGFFCDTEKDFDEWCQHIKKMSQIRGALPMFELVEHQPSHFCSPDVLSFTTDSFDTDRLERFFDSEDEEFEILSL